MMKKIKQHALKLAMLLSLLLHVLAFAILGLGLDWLHLLQPALAQPQQQPEKEPIVFTFAETPESARIEQPDAEAKYASDKNAQAQNPEAPEDLPLGEAYAGGAVAEADMPPQLKSQTGEAAAFQNPSPSASVQTFREETPERVQAGDSPAQTSYGSSSFRREFLTGQNSAPPSPESSPGRDQRDSRAPTFGSFSLNTYNWDFAPYLLWLKKRIQSNIYPPPAFTHMGLISGQTRLRFRIHRDGALQGLELLDYRGHVSLMQTSMRAVEVSVPFKKLPDGFPEEYLEVTAQFDYTILRADSP